MNEQRIGHQEENPPGKTLSDVVIFLEQGAIDLHMVQLMPLPRMFVHPSIHKVFPISTKFGT